MVVQPLSRESDCRKTKVSFPAEWRAPRVGCGNSWGASQRASGMDDLFVYIVDDDASVRKGLARLMHSAGYQTCAFGTGDAFLAALRPDCSGCVVLDISMPQLIDPGLQDRLNRRHIGLPVIATSARDDEDIRDRARSLGAQFFLRKPVDDQALLDAIEWVTGPQQT